MGLRHLQLGRPNLMVAVCYRPPSDDASLEKLYQCLSSLPGTRPLPGVVKVRGNSGAVTSPSRRRAGFSMGGIVKMVVFRIAKSELI